MVAACLGFPQFFGLKGNADDLYNEVWEAPQ